MCKNHSKDTFVTLPNRAREDRQREKKERGICGREEEREREKRNRGRKKKQDYQ